jgi:hypothetical protein
MWQQTLLILLVCVVHGYCFSVAAAAKQCSRDTLAAVFHLCIAAIGR